MTYMTHSNLVLARKDEVEGPIPTAWREALREIVEAFAAGDYSLENGIPNVEPVSAETASHIRNSVHDYGATLITLPEATWASSVCIWYGEHWDALVDLWTRDESRTDLVLQVRVTETHQGFAINIHMVYVP